MSKNYSFVPAIKQPLVVPYSISGNSALAFLNDFNSYVDKKFKRNQNLKVLNLRDVDGVPTIVGSNPLVLPVVQRLVGSGKRVGLPEDLQRTLNDGDTLSIKDNHYVDLGLVLDFTGRNHNMAVDFYEQLPRRLKKFDRLPAVVVGYDLKNLKSGEYGLGLVANKSTHVRPAKILSGNAGNFNDEDVSLETGLPSKLFGGNRTLYTASQGKPSLDNLGLSGLCLGGGLSVNSVDDDLASSDGGGRVVLF